MKKIDELVNGNSCLNKAKDEELLFVLLGRDVATPATILFWCNARIILGKNTVNDPQIREARELAETIEKEQQSKT